MRYYIAIWLHDGTDEPVWMAYEVDPDARVLRTIETFAGPVTVEKRSAAEEGLETLADAPFTLDDLDRSNPALVAFEITQRDFQAYWTSL